jgi:hypothetical protein
MAQNIAWKDLISLPRYRNQQLYLDNTLQLLYTPGLFSSALASLLTPASGFKTSLQKLSGNSYPHLIAQLYHHSEQPSAKLAFLAPSTILDHPDFSRLLSYVSKQAGEMGAFQILAEVPRDQPAAETLYQAGFRPYADQSIWKLPLFNGGDREKCTSWCPLSGVDKLKIDSLYQRTVPQNIQRVEPPRKTPELQGLVLVEEENLLGFARTEIGPRGVLVDLILDPSLQVVDPLLKELGRQLAMRGSRDVYFRVRSYQSAVSSALDAIGAWCGLPQTAVVKKLAVHYNATQRVFGYQAFDKQPDITTPISNLKSNR